MRSALFLSALLAPSALIAAPFPVRALSPQQVGEIAQSVTVQIEGQSMGSGVLIQKRQNQYYVLTTAQVVAESGPYSVTTVDDRRYEVPRSQIQFFPKLDLALLTFGSTGNYPVVEIGSPAAAGDAVYVSGFSQPTMAINQPLWNLSPGSLNASANTSLDGGYGLLYSNNTLPGMGGGALLNGQGQLIGIHGKTQSQKAIQRTGSIYLRSRMNLGISMRDFLAIAPQHAPSLGFESLGSKTSDPQLSADDLLLSGSERYLQGDYTTAVDRFNQAVKKSPSAQIYLYRGLAYAALDEGKKAISSFDRAIKVDPQFSDAYIIRAFARYKPGQREEALDDFSEAIRLVPFDANLRFSRATLYSLLQQHRDAIADYSEAIRLDQTNPNFFYSRGLAYLALNEYRSAIADFNQVIERDPSHAAAFFSRGEALEASNKLEESLFDFRKAGGLYEQQGNAERSREALLRSRQVFLKRVFDALNEPE